MAHPPAPWELRGSAALIPVPVRAAAARAAGVPSGARLLTAGGWTLGGLLVADYDATATLPYHELVVFSGLAAVHARPAAVVSHIYVDLQASLEGGRAIWGLPKELAHFSVAGDRIEVSRADGTPLVRLRVQRRPRHGRIPLWAPVVGTLDGRAVRTGALGRLRASPATADVEVPAASPFAGLGLSGRRLAVAGDQLDLPFPAPDQPNAGATTRSGIDPARIRPSDAG
jgi:acetoacetate decarboxylase